MENLDKKAKILAKIVSVPGGGADDCALMRLARANGAGWLASTWNYLRLAEQNEGLTTKEAWSIAYGWDMESKGWGLRIPVIYPEWVALGEAAARACGVALNPADPARLERACVATVDLGPKVPVPA